ncbi:hypothetical protein FRC05_001758 [Tulasnella sp. 425]|nr:hypothetical protein FRC05_001758 [Tulasnella sp. 425]
MKSTLASGSLAALLLASSAVDAVVCPYFLPAKFPNPFAATAAALSGYYLQAGSDGSAKLVQGGGLVAVRYGSNAPLGLWLNPPPLANACPAYKWLNAAAPATAVGYETLTWDASYITYWNATSGSDLSTVVDGKSISKFIACKPIAVTDSSYTLFLQTAPVDTITDVPSSIDKTTCVQTKIIVG